MLLIHNDKVEVEKAIMDVNNYMTFIARQERFTCEHCKAVT